MQIRKYHRSEAHTAIIPEMLRLPDGREVRVKSLENRVTQRTHINLLNQQVKRIPDASERRPKVTKYTVEERIWQSQATVAEIQLRYGSTEKQAQSMKYTSKYVIQKLDL